ncbi:MAG: cobalt-precorrin-5B (C(1))-methyltransferase, partial [Acetobacteraceae bacterium]
MDEGKKLRRGWTTGACATAAAKAAYAALLHGDFPDPVTIRLPGGEAPAFALARAERTENAALAAVVKDAGDDPDVTHGALVAVTVRLLPKGAGLRFVAGPGVGTVTRPGLPIPPGEPAINPGPRAMIRAALDEISPAPDAEVEISIADGEKLAERTLNGRLGIVGGLSVLGTTGIVVPYSCAAWIDSIHRGVDVARAMGIGHVAGSTGSASERAVQALHGLPEVSLIEMGDFVGGMLKYLRRHPVPRVTVAT